jgi:sec-independent protein translocase protein TatC
MSDDSATLWDHLEDLRSTLIKMGWVVLIFTLAAFALNEPLLQYLKKPLHTDSLIVQEIKTHRVINTQSESQIFQVPPYGIYKSSKNAVRLANTASYELSPGGKLEWEESSALGELLLLSPMEGFTTSLKVSLWLGIALSSPFWLYFIFQFIAPALHKNERALIIPFAFLSLFFVSLGLTFAYKITIPLANSYLLAFNKELGVNFWSLSAYIDYTLLLLLANAVAFELFAVILLLVHYGILKAGVMQEKRKHVIVAAFILGALLTPPDVLSQLLMAIPLVILYEIAILYARSRAQKFTQEE